MSNFDDVILYYQHPHIQTLVQNNTVRTEVLADVPDVINSIQVVMASEGKDNVIQHFKSLPVYLEEHGTPNFALHGQAPYNVTKTLGTNVAGVYVMRIMPDDAEHANIVILAKYKVNKELLEGESEGGKTRQVLEIKHEAMVINGATSIEELNLKLSELDTEEAGDDGYYQTPVQCLYVQGRGVFGNKYRCRFVDATAYEDPDNRYKTFRLDVYKMDQALRRKESIFGTLDPDSFDAQSKQSLYIDDIINDPETGSGKIHSIINEYGISKILETYNSMEDVETLEVGQFDPFFGKTMLGLANDRIKLTTGESGLNLSSIDGFALSGGNDGTFAVSPLTKGRSTAQVREKAIEEMYIKAFNGELDKSIRSRFSTPALYMLDANHTDDVKRALAQLNIHRTYNLLHLDSGLLNTVNECIEWGESYKNVAADNITKEMHHYKIRDLDYTGKTIPVTTTYFMAGELPLHFKNKGIDVPFAMGDATIRDIVKGSFKPVIDPDENDVKKELYNLRLNCYETVKYNVYQRTTAITSNPQISDLLDEFNVHILNKAVTVAEEVLRDKIYKLSEATDRSAYTKDANRKLQFELGRLVRSVTVEFKMSPRDEVNNILRLALRIVYKTVTKRGIVEVYIDPRANVQ